jgi:hypothetical protein
MSSFYVECVTADQGYAVGDRVVVSSSVQQADFYMIGMGVGGNNTEGFSCRVNSSSVMVRFASQGIRIVHGTAATWVVITTANWRFGGVVAIL